MTVATLPDRSIIEIGGDEAETFLDNILTCKVIGLETGEASFGALLTPQGKILFDFFLIKTNEGYWIDTASELVDELIKRLMFYRLRAKVSLSKVENIVVEAYWNSSEPPKGSLIIQDPRHSDLGWRVYDESVAQGETHAYLEHRIDLGIPEGGMDFQYGDAYPHEVLMDQFGGVDFKKGCYVGQEVVSRMQHRGTTKKRVIKISAEVAFPETGTDVMADGKNAGVVGSVHHKAGLALLRLDRVHEAGTVEAGGVSLHTQIPDWVDFTWPEAR
ncbi:MAG: folate-binding protein YgfZ [Rhizobiaceae bacterium]|nr:folate-binding protein YgfZ [Rhizobiaceae bacterium]